MPQSLAAAFPNRWAIPVGAVVVHGCIGSVCEWSTFNRPIQALLAYAELSFGPIHAMFTTALARPGLGVAFDGPWVERRGPQVAGTAAAIFLGSRHVLGGAQLALRQSLLVFPGMGGVGSEDERQG